MPGGRPSSYSESMLEKAKDYLVNYQTNHGDEVPTVFGLSGVLGVARSTIYEWDNVEFSDTLEAINAKQAQVLCNKGLTGDFNPTIAKLMLHNQGLTDKITNEHTGGVTVVAMDATDEKI